MEKQFDVICMGRVAVDLYSQQIGARLEDASSFAKYLGGSSGNVAYGTARQGLRSSMLARVGDEHMGRFLREELNQVGCDTSHLITDKQRLTALVLLGIKDRDTFPLIFYRDNCADMAITASDVDESYIASARCLAITGTHLSHPQTREAVLTALGYARRHGVRTVLDIDYRPVLWGLTALGDGETRFIAADKVTRELQEVLHLFDVIVGTEEEFHIAGGSTDTLQALGQVRAVSEAALVCKRGALGCSVYTDAIPPRLDDAGKALAAAEPDADTAFDADRSAAATFIEAEGRLGHIARDRETDARQMVAHPLAIIDRFDREARLGMSGAVFHHRGADILA